MFGRQSIKNKKKKVHKYGTTNAETGSNLANGSSNSFSLVFKTCLIDFLKHADDMSCLDPLRTSSVYELAR
jgi:hypothetical protein